MSESSTGTSEGGGRFRMPETPRLIVTLAVAGLLSGLIIVTSYRVTLPIIHANDARFLRQAVFEVVPGSETMQRLIWTGDHLEPAAGVLGPEPSVYGAYTADGEFVGYAVPAEGPGFQDTIRLIYGFNPETERIVGMSVLESRETPGLGDRIYKDPAFGAQFKDLAVSPRIELVKEAPTSPNQVDAITGATISSTAVVTIIQRSDETWLERLPEADAAPKLVEMAEGESAGGEEKGGPIPGGKS